MESFIIDHLRQNRAIDKYIIGSSDVEALKPLYKHGIVYTPYGYIQGTMHEQKMNISWDLLFIGYPCHHFSNITGIKCNCDELSNCMKRDIIDQYMLPVSNEQVREAMKIDDTYLPKNIDRLIAYPSLLLGNYPLLKICQAMKGRRVRPFVRSLDTTKLSIEDRFTAAAILMDTEECKQLMSNSRVRLDVFGCYGFAKEDKWYRIAMIEEGVSRQLVITGKAKIFVRKNRRHFSNDVILLVLGIDGLLQC